VRSYRFAAEKGAGKGLDKERAAPITLTANEEPQTERTNLIVHNDAQRLKEQLNAEFSQPSPVAQDRTALLTPGAGGSTAAVAAAAVKADSSTTKKKGKVASTIRV